MIGRAKNVNYKLCRLGCGKRVPVPKKYASDTFLEICYDCVRKGLSRKRRPDGEVVR